MEMELLSVQLMQSHLSLQVLQARTCWPSHVIWHSYYITQALGQIYAGSQHPCITIFRVIAALSAFHRGERYQAVSRGRSYCFYCFYCFHSHNLVKFFFDVVFHVRHCTPLFLMHSGKISDVKITCFFFGRGACFSFIRSIAYPYNKCQMFN